MTTDKIDGGRSKVNAVDKQANEDELDFARGNCDDAYLLQGEERRSEICITLACAFPSIE